jgi:ABC-type nitrate/sulfonate/bicarbonate transport system substrate-binding protein
MEHMNGINQHDPEAMSMRGRNARGARRRRTTLMLLLCVPALGAGVLPALSPAASAASDSSPATITVGLAGGFATSWTTFMVAYGGGYFNDLQKKFHTTVQTQTYGSGGLATTALTSQSIQFEESAISSILPAAAAQKDVMATMQQWNGVGVVLVGAQKYQSTRGTNLAAYNGAKWCFTTPASTSQVALQGAATAAGLNWSNQQQIAIGSTVGYLPTMQNGSCDITAMDTTSASLATIEGIGYLVQNPNTLANQVKDFGGVQAGGCLITTQAFTKQYPALTAAFQKAMLRAQLFLQKNVNNANAIYAKLPTQFTSVSSLGAFAQQWSLLGPSYATTSGLFPASEVKSTLAFNQTTGVIQPTATINTAQTFNNRYTTVAYRSLAIPVPSSSSGSAPSTTSTTS